MILLNIQNLPTPAFLVDLDKLEQNITEVARLCRENKKQLWPMVKTHKSSYIASLQYNYGAEGFLTGTLLEAIKLVEHGFDRIMIAYPITSKTNLAKLLDISKHAHITLTLDSVESARIVNAELARKGVKLDYLIKIDTGLHRLGVRPEALPELMEKLSTLKHLNFKGIATHPGHVYAVASREQVKAVADQEIELMKKACQILGKCGYVPEYVATGCTPTFQYEAVSDVFNVLRPGNYVFYDAIQVALGVVSQEKCALTVMASVISNPSENLFIIDAGSKCLNLDKGAHGTSLVRGYGIVVDHPELVVESLSEEVGKLRALRKTKLSVGHKIQIIPNHACSVANLTSYLLCHRGGRIEKIIEVDARSASSQSFFS